jgi:hypothetical protein
MNIYFAPLLIVNQIKIKCTPSLRHALLRGFTVGFIFTARRTCPERRYALVSVRKSRTPRDFFIFKT